MSFFYEGLKVEILAAARPKEVYLREIHKKILGLGLSCIVYVDKYQAHNVMSFLFKNLSRCCRILNKVIFSSYVAAAAHTNW